jgi:hypothetical protein
MEDLSDYKWLASRVKKALTYLENNYPSSYDKLNEYVEIYLIPILQGDLDINEEDEYFDLMDSILDELEQEYPQIFK